MKPTSPTVRLTTPPGKAAGVRATGLLVGFALVAGLSAGVGCAKATAPGAKDPETQSIAEHDLAADALQKGSLRTALVHAKKALDLDPANYNAQLLTANIYLGFCANSTEECRLDEAEHHAREALKYKADFGDATNTLGVILTHEKKYPEAISTLKPLTENMVYNTPELAWGNLGEAYLENGDVDLAVAALKRALALQPAFCVGSYRLGLAFVKKGDLQAAKQALSGCLEADFEQCRFPEAYEARGQVFSKLSDQDGAKRDFERCAKVGKGTPIGKRCELFAQRP
jgi:Tfp pilus assembly protein PilF